MSSIRPSSTPPAAIDAAVVDQCIALLEQVSDLLGEVTPLSGSDITHSLKPRKGGAQVVTQVFALCNHHGVVDVGPATADGMSAQMERALALRRIGVQMGAVQKKLSDATFSAESSCWNQATALYTVLRRLARMDPTVAIGLAPVRAFFAKKKKTEGTEGKAGTSGEPESQRRNP